MQFRWLQEEFHGFNFVDGQSCWNTEMSDTRRTPERFRDPIHIIERTLARNGLFLDDWRELTVHYIPNKPSCFYACRQSIDRRCSKRSAIKSLDINNENAQREMETSVSFAYRKKTAGSFLEWMELSSRQLLQLIERFNRLVSLAFRFKRRGFRWRSQFTGRPGNKRARSYSYLKRVREKTIRLSRHSCTVGGN